MTFFVSRAPTANYFVWKASGSGSVIWFVGRESAAGTAGEIRGGREGGGEALSPQSFSQGLIISTTTGAQSQTITSYPQHGRPTAHTGS